MSNSKPQSALLSVVFILLLKDSVSAFLFLCSESFILQERSDISFYTSQLSLEYHITNLYTQDT